MQIFSYIFYTFSKVYKASLDKVHPEIYASGFLSITQWFNVLTVIHLFLSKDSLIILSVIASVVLILINGVFFFNRKTLKKFDKRWDKEPKGQRFFRRFLVIVYVVATFAVPIIIYM